MSPDTVALLGCGNYQKTHARRLRQRDDVRIVGVCDIDVNQAQELIGRSLADADPPPPIFTDPARMYEAVEPDAVFITTPHTLHYITITPSKRSTPSVTCSSRNRWSRGLKTPTSWLKRSHNLERYSSSVTTHLAHPNLNTCASKCVARHLVN